MTDDRIGRSMKKCVNMRYFLAASALGRRRAGRDDRHRLPGDDLEHAVDDDAITFGEALRDDDVLVAVVVADDHRADLGHVARVHDVHDVAVAALLHGKLRYDDGVRTQGADHARASRTCRAADRTSDWESPHAPGTIPCPG